MLKSLGVFKDYSDGSLKSVFELGNKKIIEMTLLFNKEKMDVVCCPTHHFCNLGCKMCHLTNNKLNKTMNAIGVDAFLEALIKTLSKNRTDKKNLLISFMGVGEPLLNLPLIEGIYRREDEIKKQLGYNEISYALATMMPNNNLKKLTEIVNDLNIPLKVHFSLHTPIDEDRKELIPSTRVSVEEALNYLTEYRNVIQKNDKIMEKYIKFHRTNDPVEIHYTLIDKVNDGNKELTSICKILEKYKIAIKFIRFNPKDTLTKSKKEDLWIKTIKQKVPNLRIKTYSPPGRQIGSSCGEFTKHYYHEEIETKEEKEEFENWKKHHEITV